MIPRAEYPVSTNMGTGGRKGGRRGEGDHFAYKPNFGVTFNHIRGTIRFFADVVHKLDLSIDT